MANYNEHKCFTCGQIFDYCRRCAATPVVYKAEGFCSEKCSDIFATLSKHSCNLISAEEALKELSAYNLDEITLEENIIAHIERIRSEAGVTTENGTKTETIVVSTEVVEEVAETPIVKQNKNNKKKW